MDYCEIDKIDAQINGLLGQKSILKKKEEFDKSANDLAMFRDSLIDAGFSVEFAEQFILKVIGGMYESR